MTSSQSLSSDLCSSRILRSLGWGLPTEDSGQPTGHIFKELLIYFQETLQMAAKMCPESLLWNYPVRSVILEKSADIVHVEPTA
jgi:hypothetical protein